MMRKKTSGDWLEVSFPNERLFSFQSGNIDRAIQNFSKKICPVASKSTNINARSWAGNADCFQEKWRSDSTLPACGRHLLFFQWAGTVALHFEFSLLISQNDDVAGFLELRNPSMLTQPNSADEMIQFEMPVKQFFGVSIVRFGISPFDQNDRLRWFQALHNVITPVSERLDKFMETRDNFSLTLSPQIHSGMLELGRRVLGTALFLCFCPAFSSSPQSNYLLSISDKECIKRRVSEQSTAQESHFGSGDGFDCINSACATFARTRSNGMLLVLKCRGPKFFVITGIVRM